MAETTCYEAKRGAPSVSPEATLNNNLQNPVHTTKVQRSTSSHLNYPTPPKYLYTVVPTGSLVFFAELANLLPSRAYCRQRMLVSAHTLTARDEPFHLQCGFSSHTSFRGVVSSSFLRSVDRVQHNRFNRHRWCRYCPFCHMACLCGCIPCLSCPRS